MEGLSSVAMQVWAQVLIHKFITEALDDEENEEADEAYHALVIPNQGNSIYTIPSQQESLAMPSKNQQ
jgi:hypothetical protein